MRKLLGMALRCALISGVCLTLSSKAGAIPWFHIEGILKKPSGHHGNLKYTKHLSGYVPSAINHYNIRSSDKYKGQLIQQWLREKKYGDLPSNTLTQAASTPLFIDAGGTQNFVGEDGNSWVADEYFDGGSTTDRGSITVQGTKATKVFQHERYCMNGYHVPLKNGTYEVTLGFAETYDGITGPGQRVFDVNVGGTTIANLDVFAETGGRNIALVKKVTATVNNGMLDIGFTQKSQCPEINAIEIASQSGTSTGGGTSLGELSIVATQMYDNFDSYGDTLPVVNWPNPGGYMINPWGDPNSGFFPSLSTDYKPNDSKYAMKLGYNLEDKGWNSMGHLLDNQDWSAWDGVRYWVKPDGSGRTLTFGFLEHIGSDGVKHFHYANYQMARDTMPVVVTIPWSAFGADKTNVTGVEEQIWSVSGAPGPGTIYVGKIELIKTASPLSGIVATPADQNS